MTRLSNGVRARSDGGGDTWAGEHRYSLPGQYLMQDLDAVAGVMAFGTRGVDRLFSEFAPDGPEHRGDLVRRFGVVALFDRKTTLRACEMSQVSTAFYLYLARTLSSTQPVPVRFFYVVGKAAPWTLVEIDITTGKRIGTTELAGEDWDATWECLGLLSAREQLHAWLDAGEVTKVAVEPAALTEVTEGAVGEQEPAEVVEEEEAVEEEMHWRSRCVDDDPPWRSWWDAEEEFEEEDQGLTM